MRLRLSPKERAAMWGLQNGTINIPLYTTPPPAQAELDRLRDRVAALEAENAELKSSVIAFCAPWAVRYARDHGLPEGHLSPVHYDILERCGARMVDFTRAALNPQTGEAG